MPLGAREPDAVDDRRVVQRVADDGIVLVEKRLEETSVRVEARRVEDGILDPQKRRDLALEGAMRVLGATDEAHARETEAICVERAVGGLDDFRVGGQAKVVVCAKVQNRRRRAAHANRRALSSKEQPLRLVEPRGGDRVEGGGVDPLRFAKHRRAHVTVGRRCCHEKGTYGAALSP